MSDRTVQALVVRVFCLLAEVLVFHDRHELRTVNYELRTVN
jgi:hypothetical protein